MEIIFWERKKMNRTKVRANNSGLPQCLIMLVFRKHSDNWKFGLYLWLFSERTPLRQESQAVKTI
jgi:hypothetical protein